MNIPQEDRLQSNKTKPKHRRRNKEMCLEDRPVLELDAAGIDVGVREMFVAVPPRRDDYPVQVFATFTEGDLFTPWSKTRSNITNPSGLPETPTERSDWK
jgi:hypothetical protein